MLTRVRAWDLGPGRPDPMSPFKQLRLHSKKQDTLGIMSVTWQDRWVLHPHNLQSDCQSCPHSVLFLTRSTLFAHHRPLTSQRNTIWHHWIQLFSKPTPYLVCLTSTNQWHFIPAIFLCDIHASRWTGVGSGDGRSRRVWNFSSHSFQPQEVWHSKSLPAWFHYTQRPKGTD